MKRINIKKINNNNLENTLLFLEREKRYKKIDKKILLNLAIKFTKFSQKNFDWRYLNLALKIKDHINKNNQLNSEINKSIILLKKRLFKN